MSTQSSLIKKVVAAGFFAAATALIIPSGLYAEEGHSSGTEKGHKGSGGSDKGHKGKGGESGHGKSTIVGNSSADIKGKKGATTKPWAHDGLTNATGGVEIELGRLNAGRAPAKVLQQQLWELANTGGLTSVYMGTDTNGDLTALAAAIKAMTDRLVKVDSPLTNLALYKEVLLNTKNTTSVYTKKGEEGATTAISMTALNMANSQYDDLELAAIFLAAGADKGIPITINTVLGMNVILGISMDAATAQKLADDAAMMQEAIVYNHDNTDN